MRHETAINNLEVVQEHLIEYNNPVSAKAVGEAIALINTLWGESCDKGTKLSKMEPKLLTMREEINALIGQVAAHEVTITKLRARKKK